MNTTIFLTVTAGRTGTGYLQQLFSLLPDFTSVHEPSIPTTNFWKTRLEEISNYNKPNYIETSHLICKGWIEPLLYTFSIVPNLILLCRPARQIATSLFALDTIPGRTQSGQTYLLSPKNKSSMTTIDAADTLTDYQLCYWYCLEIEYRQQYYRNLILDQNGKVFSTSVEQLKKSEHFIQMLDYFNLSYDNSTLTKYERKKNANINLKAAKKHRSLIFSDDELNAQEQYIIERMYKR